jgi:TctA family transporter
MTLLSGGLGYLMVRYGFPRPPFILGFILGHLAETYFYISTMRYEMQWLYRPKVLIILLIAVGVALYPFVQKRRLAKKEAVHAS